jgi:dolichyl-phosphate beta-glucosyltransferase
MPKYSIIIPAYNEENRLPATLQSVYDYMQKRRDSFEIIVVDDGSSDGTAAYVQNFPCVGGTVRVISYSPNKGKGSAVRTGIFAARGELLLIDDADGSSPIEELSRLEAELDRGADIVIGSRAKPDPERVVQALAHRKLIGGTFNRIVRMLLLDGLYDTQCGFKLFKREAARNVFCRSSLNGYGFDVEVLYVARLLGYEIAETAINWANVDGSKVNVFIDSPKMFLELLNIKRRGLTGAYRYPSIVAPTENEPVLSNK